MSGHKETNFVYVKHIFRDCEVHHKQVRQQFSINKLKYNQMKQVDMQSLHMQFELQFRGMATDVFSLIPHCCFEGLWHLTLHATQMLQATR